LIKKLLLHILFEKSIDILALEMASPGNLQHRVSCIGTLSLLITVSRRLLTLSVGVICSSSAGESPADNHLPY